MEEDVKRSSNYAEIGSPGFELPDPPTPEGYSTASWFEEQCRLGLVKRYGEGAVSSFDELREVRSDVVARYECEAETIVDNGFHGYFLIVSEYVCWAREQGICIGPGRGPAVGSIVCYALGITDVDPLAYGLLFERFLNPDNPELPDIDVDFANAGRNEVAEHIEELYGSAHVAHISALLPQTDGSVVRKVHSAGVAVSRCPLAERTSLWRDAVTGFMVTERDAPSLASVGVAKFDLFGMGVLDHLVEACRRASDAGGFKLDPNEIPCDDDLAFALLRGELPGGNEGVFLAESPAFTEFYKRVPPRTFQDVMASVALMRPKPIEAGIADDYVDVASGKRIASLYEDERIWPIVEETRGVLVYQEQTMEIAKRMCGFSPGLADDLRRAMVEKDLEELPRLRADWIHGAVANGFDSALAQRTWEDSEKFARYVFCRAHAAAYATLVMRTAYMKAHHPDECMAIWNEGNYPNPE